MCTPMRACVLWGRARVCTSAFVWMCTCMYVCGYICVGVGVWGVEGSLISTRFSRPLNYTRSPQDNQNAS